MRVRRERERERFPFYFVQEHVKYPFINDLILQKET